MLAIAASASCGAESASGPDCGWFPRERPAISIASSVETASPRSFVLESRCGSADGSPWWPAPPIVAATPGDVLMVAGNAATIVRKAHLWTTDGVDWNLPPVRPVAPKFSRDLEAAVQSVTVPRDLPPGPYMVTIYVDYLPDDLRVWYSVRLEVA